MLRDPRDFTAFSAVFRISDGYGGETEIVDALILDAGELSERLRLTPDELGGVVREWALQNGDPHRTVELQHRETDIGASATTLTLLATFIGGAALEIALEELYRLVRSRLVVSSREREIFEYLSNLDDDALVDELRRRVGYATDRRRTDLELVQTQRAPEEVSAVFDTTDGTTYVVRVTQELCRVARVADPAS